MHRVLLIIEDDASERALQSLLVRNGWRVAVSRADNDSLLETAGPFTPNVLIVDCRSQPCIALSVRRVLSSECNLKELPTIVLLSPDALPGMDWTSIDDFVLDPVNEEELLCRLRLLVTRSGNMDSDQIIRVGSLLIDTANYRVSVDGLPVDLTFKEYELLRFLATHPGKVFTREALLDHVWGYDYYGGTRTVDVHVRRLRAKLEPSCDYLIETVRNVGYRFALE